MFKYYLEEHPNLSDDKLAIVIMVAVLLIIMLPLLSFIDVEDEEIEDEKSIEDLKPIENQVEQVSHSFKFSSYYIEPVLAGLLLISFFLPFIDFKIFQMSAFKLLKDATVDNVYYVLWLVPFFSIVLMLTSRFRVDLKLLAFTTGLTPYLLFIFTFILYGEIHPLEVFVFGFYIMAILGFMLMTLSVYKFLKFGKLFGKIDETEEKIYNIPSSFINYFIGLALIASFFLPWITIMIMPMSGYELMKDVPSILVPLSAFGLIIATALKNNSALPIFIGLVPFVFLGIQIFQNEENNILNMLSYGGYLTLLLSLLLIILTILKMRSMK